MSGSNRHGFTLIETLVVIVLIGVIMLAGWPKVQQALVRTDVRSARSAVITTIQQAKAAAVARGRTVTLQFDNGGGRVWAELNLSGGGLDTVGTLQPLSTQYGVTLAASQATFGFDSRGLGTSGADMNIILTRGSERDSVELTRYGRVAK